MQKIPYMLVVGDKEVEENAVNVRKYGEQKSETVPFEEFLENLAKQKLKEIIFKEKSNFPFTF